MRKKFIFDKNTRFRLFLVLAIAFLAVAEFHEPARLLYRQSISDPRKIRAYFRSNEIRKLQLGAGKHQIEGWLNTDISENAEVYLDATAKYPFADGSFHYIFAEDLIEHLTWEGGLNMLKESYRVLAPGGKIRIITPNVLRSMRLVTDPDDPETRKAAEAFRKAFRFETSPILPIYVFNKSLREWGHNFFYDPASLRKTFELAGFTQIREYAIDEKADPVFEKAQYRTTELGDDVWTWTKFESMVFEGVR